MAEYTNNAQTLADVTSPVFAASQMATQDEAANQAAQIANTTAQGQQAAEIQKPGLANLFTQAQTGNENAIGAQNASKAAEMQGTQATAIQAGNAGNQAAMSADQAKSLTNLGGTLGQVAGMLDSVPQAGRPAAMAQIAQKYGVDLSTLPPQIAQGDPDILRSIGQKAVQAGSEYQTQQLKGTQEFQKAVTTTGQLVGGRQGVAETAAESRQAVADTNSETKKALAPLGAVIGQLTVKAANNTATPEEKSILQWAQNSQQLIRSGSPFQAGITGTNVQGNVPAVPGNAAPAGPQPIPSTPAAQQAVTQKFQAYEPDKYNYVQAINPKTGQMDIGRIPK